jgi:hypothetical protein
MLGIAPPVVLPPGAFPAEVVFVFAPAPGISTGGALGVKTAALGMHEDAAAEASRFGFAFALMVALPLNEHAVFTRCWSS